MTTYNIGAQTTQRGSSNPLTTNTLVVNLYFCECLRTCGFKPLIRGKRPHFAVYRNAVNRKMRSVCGIKNHQTANSRSVCGLSKNSRLPNRNHP
ncbi:unnamed protein product [Prunus armeniaca]